MSPGCGSWFWPELLIQEEGQGEGHSAFYDHVSEMMCHHSCIFYLFPQVTILLITDIYTETTIYQALFDGLHARQDMPSSPDPHSWLRFPFTTEFALPPPRCPGFPMGEPWPISDNIPNIFNSSLEGFLYLFAHAKTWLLGRCSVCGLILRQVFPLLFPWYDPVQAWW